MSLPNYLVCTVYIRKLQCVENGVYGVESGERIPFNKLKVRRVQGINTHVLQSADWILFHLFCNLEFGVYSNIENILGVP